MGFSARKRTFILKVVFLALIATFFIIVIGTYFMEWLRGAPFIPAIAIFSLLGAALIFLAMKEKEMLKKFLLLTGASSAGFFVFVLLHNFFYGLGVITSNITILKYLMEILHIAFFVIAVFICPIGFLVGVIGSLVLFTKKSKNKKQNNR